MAERLTEHKTTKGITRIVIKPYVIMSDEMQPIADKLCAFEDILEKYGIRSVEELDKELQTLKFIESVMSDYSITDYNELDKVLKDFSYKNKQEYERVKIYCDIKTDRYQQAKTEGDDDK